MVTQKSGVNEKGETEFYLVGLEKYEDFDIVIHELVCLNVKVLDSLDGIYSRIAILESKGDRFKVIYHEDVGVYSFLIDETSIDKINRLCILLDKVVQRVNSL